MTTDFYTCVQFNRADGTITAIVGPTKNIPNCSASETTDQIVLDGFVQVDPFAMKVNLEDRTLVPV